MRSKDRIIDILVSLGCVKFGDFVLSSGKRSNVYVDLRKVISHPREFAELVKLSSPMVSRLPFDLLAGVESGGIPFATAFSLRLMKPLIYVRKEPKDHGLKKMIEGEYLLGSRVLVIDDVSTTGNSIARAVETLRMNGLEVSDAFVLVEREEGAAEKLASMNVKLHSAVTLREVMSRSLADIRERAEGPFACGGWAGP